MLDSLRQRGGGGGLATALLWMLRRAGGPGLETAVRLDLVRALGLREAWRRRGAEARVAALPAGRMRPGYRQIWLDAARAAGAAVAELGDGFMELRRDGRMMRVWHSWVSLDDAVTLRLAENKLLARRILEAAALPVPGYRHFDLDELSEARSFLARAAGPCVVKPLDSAGGSGTTSGIRTVAQLRRACLRAGRIGGELLIERQVPGDLYRLLLLDGDLLDVIRRLPPRVTGDGSSTIAELVASENARRIAAAEGGHAGLLRIDLDAVFALECAGLSLTSVPPAGARIPVKTVVNQNSAADNVNARDDVCPELVEEAVAAARALGVRLAGVDVITRDPGRALSNGGGAILEVNGTPGLHYHYEIADRERSVPVAAAIAKRLLAGH